MVEKLRGAESAVSIGRTEGNVFSGYGVKAHSN